MKGVFRSTTSMKMLVKLFAVLEQLIIESKARNSNYESRVVISLSRVVWKTDICYKRLNIYKELAGGKTTIANNKMDNEGQWQESKCFRQKTRT